MPKRMKIITSPKNQMGYVGISMVKIVLERSSRDEGYQLFQKMHAALNYINIYP